MRISLLLSICATTLFAACSKSDDTATTLTPAGPPPAQPVKAVVTRLSSIDNRIEATGTVLANESVEIRSEISGRIVGVYFKEGDPVQAGALLVKIDDRELQSQLAKTVLSIDLAKEDEARKKKLLDAGGISREEYDASRNALLKLETDKQLLTTQIDKTRITAPFNGTIGLRNVSEGGYVSAATLIADLQQTVPVKVEFNVPEKYASAMRNGVQVTFTVEGSTQQYIASVYAKEPRIDLSTRTMKVRATAPNNDRTLIPGAFAKLMIDLGAIEQTIVVPSESLVPAISGQTVILVKEGKATVQPVKTGIRSSTGTQIVSGLQAGDTILTTGLLTVRPGMPVKPIVVNSPSQNN